jgi:hypothetical protein
MDDTKKYTTPDMNIGCIDLMSRYRQKYEADQMAVFVSVLGGMSPLSMSQNKMVFYDSSGQVAHFEFEGGQSTWSDSPWRFLTEHVVRAILEAARQKINQFVWEGFIEHGFRHARQRD